MRGYARAACHCLVTESVAVGWGLGCWVSCIWLLLGSRFDLVSASSCSLLLQRISIVVFVWDGQNEAVRYWLWDMKNKYCATFFSEGRVHGKVHTFEVNWKFNNLLVFMTMCKVFCCREFITRTTMHCLCIDHCKDLCEYHLMQWSMFCIIYYND